MSHTSQITAQQYEMFHRLSIFLNSQKLQNTPLQITIQTLETFWDVAETQSLAGYKAWM